MERKVPIGNKWWKIITIYSKEMKTTRRRRRCNERKRGRSYTLRRGLQLENRRKRSKKLGRGEGGMGKENPKTRWKMQRGRN
jgi:hypothetical protein